MSSTRRLILAAILASLTFVVTAFTMVRVPFLPAREAYFHAGDAIIYLSGMVLGPLAAFTAGLGSALADLYLGATIYIPATLVIKAVMGGVAGWFLFNKTEEKTPAGRIVLGLAIPALWMSVGYYLYEVAVLQINWIVNLPGLLINLAQGAVGIILYLPLSAAVRRILPRS